METVRCKIEDGKLWFPVSDITAYSKMGKKLHNSAKRWLKNNLNPSGFKRLHVSGSVIHRAGNFLCVDSENLRIVGMYEAHLKTGKDFRAKWAELPDTPCFPSDVKKELSWRNLYKWSKAEHRKNSGLGDAEVSELRRIAMLVGKHFESPEKMMSLEEAKIKAGLIK